MSVFTHRNRKRTAAAALSVGAFFTIGGMAYADVWSNLQGDINHAGASAAYKVHSASNSAAGTISRLGPTITGMANGAVTLASAKVATVQSTVDTELKVATILVTKTANTATGKVGSTVATATNEVDWAKDGATGTADAATNATRNIAGATSPLTNMATDGTRFVSTQPLG